ncbi:MAG TPA: hypothetical protein VKY24_01845 [Reyranella sp.]|nr:hypothetical protein [Reyranella sp.]
MSNTTELRPFSPRTLFLLIGIGALAFAAMAWLMISAQDRATRIGEVAPSVESRSAIGHRAFVQLMQKLDVPVAAATIRARPSLQIVLEPRSPQDLKALLAPGGQTLVVLPKWRGYSRPYGDHLAAVSLIDLATVQALARVIADDAEIVRPASAGPWHQEVFHGDPTLGHPQLLRSDKLCPLLSSGEDMLIARVCRRPSLFVLADPDVIANHGLWRGDNAVLAMSFVSLMRNGDGPVVTPGAPGRQPVKSKPNVWALAFEPPFVLITIAALVAIAIAVWLAAMRFGPPAAEAPDRPPGVHTLIEVAARLLGARAGDRLLRRYAEHVVLDLGRRLHAPRAVSGIAETGAWLDASRQGEASELKYAVLARRIDSAGPAEIVARAAELHRWREELLNGR